MEASYPVILYILVNDTESRITGQTNLFKALKAEMTELDEVGDRCSEWNNYFLVLRFSHDPLQDLKSDNALVHSYINII